jgi:hypothetical protein
MGDEQVSRASRSVGRGGVRLWRKPCAGRRHRAFPTRDSNSRGAARPEPERGAGHRSVARHRSPFARRPRAATTTARAGSASSAGDCSNGVRQRGDRTSGSESSRAIGSSTRGTRRWHHRRSAVAEAHTPATVVGGSGSRCAKASGRDTCCSAAARSSAGTQRDDAHRDSSRGARDRGSVRHRSVRRGGECAECPSADAPAVDAHGRSRRARFGCARACADRQRLDGRATASADFTGTERSSTRQRENETALAFGSPGGSSAAASSCPAWSRARAGLVTAGTESVDARRYGVDATTRLVRHGAAAPGYCSANLTRMLRVPGPGIEPGWGYPHKILSLARLPISPPRPDQRQQRLRRSPRLPEMQNGSGTCRSRRKYCRGYGRSICSRLLKAGNGTRTRDPNLGKVVLYQLSYSRVLTSISAASATDKR